jgi:hypothetical protein
LGPKGNAEFLVWLDQLPAESGIEDISLMVERVLL